MLNTVAEENKPDTDTVVNIGPVAGMIVLSIVLTLTVGGIITFFLYKR